MRRLRSAAGITLCLAALTAGSLAASRGWSSGAGALPAAPACASWRERACYGTGEFVEYVPGDVPVVVSVPHGGSLEPASLPDRIATAGPDANTIELAHAIAQAFAARLGRAPALVMSHLSRRKLDPNRELWEAARGDLRAGLAWQEYHGFIEHATKTIESGRGLYVDLHGHGHALPRVELGYLLPRAALALPDAALDAHAARSSFRALLGSDPELTYGVSQSGRIHLSSLVRGPLSLGSLIAPIPAVPSPGVPSPGEDPYYEGGYSTRRHTQALPGLQIETPFRGVRDTAAHRAAFAERLVDALVTFAARQLNLAL
jgi:hypothetical protein